MKIITKIATSSEICANDMEIGQIGRIVFMPGQERTIGQYLLRARLGHILLEDPSCTRSAAIPFTDEVRVALLPPGTEVTLTTEN